MWFRVLAEIEGEGGMDESSVERLTQQRAISFTSDLQRNAAIVNGGLKARHSGDDSRISGGVKTDA
jgi:hypothetical protein